MNFAKSNHETLFIFTECRNNRYSLRMDHSMPQGQDSIELNFYYNCPVISIGEKGYEINGQPVTDSMHSIAKACTDEFECSDLQLLPCYRIFYSVFHIITLTRHIFSEESGKVISERQQIIYAGFASNENGSTLQIISYLQHNLSEVRYSIPCGDVCGSRWHVEEVAEKAKTDYVISVTSYAFPCLKIDYQRYCNVIFNDRYEESIYYNHHMDMLENLALLENIYGHPCTLTVAAEYCQFYEGFYSGHTNLYECIQFIS